MKLYLCDNHLPDFDEISFEDFSLAQWEELLVAARVDCLMLYGKDHWGWSYYDTKVGRRHPKLSFDLFAETSRMLRRNGIGLMTYYSIGFDNLMAVTRDDWALRTADGRKHRIGRETYPKWHSCCFNTGYRDYCKAQVRELLEAHRADFLFLDIVKHGGYTGFGQDNLPLCYCPACAEKFRRRYGMEIPRAPDDATRFRRVIQDWEMNVLDYEVVDEITSLAESIQLGVPVMFNETVHFAQRARSRMNAHFSEGRYGSWRTAAMSRLQRRAPNYGRSVVSCHPTVTAYDVSPVGPSALAAAQVAAWDGDPFLMHGPQDSRGRIDANSVQGVGRAFADLARMGGLLENRRAIDEVRILESDRQRLLDPANHSGPVLAAIDFLTYSKYPFGLIREDDLDGLAASGARALIVPRATWLTEGEAQAVRRFVSDGGLLVCGEDFTLGRCTGREGPLDPLAMGADFLLADVMGASFVRRDDTYRHNRWGGYLRVGEHPMWKSVRDTTPPLMPPCYEVALRPGATCEAGLLRPSIAMAMDRWVNWFPPPPGRDLSPGPAVVRNRYGKGTCLYFAAPYVEPNYGSPGAEALDWPRRFFNDMLETLLPAPAVRLHSDCPELIDATYYRRDGEVIVHCLNKAAAHAGDGAAPIKAGRLVLTGPLANAASAVMIPSGRELAIRREGDSLVVDVPEIAVHEVIHMRGLSE